MNCTEVKDLLGALIDNEVTDVQREELLCHIAQCEDCKREYEELQQLRKDFSQLDVQLRGAIAEKVMGKVCEEAYPKKKTPFILRHLGTAAALVIIVAAAIMIKLAPRLDSAKEAEEVSNSSLMADATEESAEDIEYNFALLDKIEEDVVLKSESLDTDGNLNINDVTPEAVPEVPMEPEAPMEAVPEAPMEPEAPMTPMEPVQGSKPTASDNKQSAIGEPDSERAEPEASFEEDFRYSNSIPFTTSVIFIDGDIQDVLPLLDNVTSVGADYANISANHVEVMEILTSNRIEITNSFTYDEATTTAIYEE